MKVLLISILLLCKEESWHRGCDQSTKATSNEEEWWQPASDVPLLGHPGEAGAKLPGDEEAQGGCPNVEADDTLASSEAEENSSGQAGHQGDNDHVPRAKIWYSYKHFL